MDDIVFVSVPTPSIPPPDQDQTQSTFRHCIAQIIEHIVRSIVACWKKGWVKQGGRKRASESPDHFEGTVFAHIVMSERASHRKTKRMDKDRREERWYIMAKSVGYGSLCACFLFPVPFRWPLSHLHSHIHFLSFTNRPWLYFVLLYGYQGPLPDCGLYLVPCCCCCMLPIGQVAEETCRQIKRRTKLQPKHQSTGTCRGAYPLFT